jgi:hypothetical protein
MLEYWKDGKKVECRAVYHRGRVGQIVILDHGGFGKNSPHPLAKYPTRAVFTIIEHCETDCNCDYVLQDKDGNRFTDEANYLYDLNEWIAWRIGRDEEKLQRNDRKIELQQAQIDILKSAIGGIRVITEDQLKMLGK